MTAQVRTQLRTNDMESIIDGWILRAIKYSDESDESLKKHCIFASPIVGKYQNGGTKAIADGIHRSPSTVENHAHAYFLYRELRANGNMRRVREMWRALPASHWWLAWSIQKAGYEAYHYLDFAQLHNWSGRDMMTEYKNDLEAGNAPIQFKRLCVSIHGLAEELLGRAETTTEQIKAVQEVRKAFAPLPA